jgi:predicted ATPase
MTDHPFRLRRVELRDFKSVAQADVSLRPLTVVVGANSSGKSTLLQSILAVTQAVRSDVGTAEFPLNGEFARLGTFEETHNFLAERADAPMEIAFELVGPPRRPSRPTLLRESPEERRRDRLQFTWRALLDGKRADGAGTSGFARLVGLQIAVSSLADNGNDPVLRLTCDIAEFGPGVSERSADLAPWLRAGFSPGRIARLGGGATGRSLREASGRVVDWIGGDSASVDAVALAGCLPIALLRRQSRFEGLANLWWELAVDFLEEDIAEQRRRVRESDSPVRASYKAVKVAAGQIGALVEAGEEEEGSPRRLGSESPKEAVMRQLGSLRTRDRQAVAKSLALLEPSQFRAQLRKELKSAGWIEDIEFVGPPGEVGDILWEFGSASQRTFGDSVRYLGPLREAPHVLYDPGPSKRDLGVAGEYSAAVLHAQAGTTVLMPTPEGRGTRRPLSEALDFWLREFGLAENARSRDQGRMGIALSVTPTGIDREVDLTSVGVGVSQVLPVILLCLLAEPGTLVILEQPELHLHPKLQQDLANFLLACTRAGRQLVVETHSEHLVNRLRYQIAQDETDETHELIRLVFAESEGGVTSYREPEINAYGGLGEDWPAGFLDLTARESQELIREALAKRKRVESALDD